MAGRESSWVLCSGSSHAELAGELASVLGLQLGPLSIEEFPDGEIGVRIDENVRGKDVCVLQSIARRPNHYLMELLIIVDALRRASAKTVTAVIPYYGYARQDRKEKERVAITARLVANLLERAGVSRVLTMDLHTEQIQGFFDVPVDNLYARPLFVRVLKEMKLRDVVVVSPDVGSNRMARKFAEDLSVDLAIVDKKRVNAGRVETGAVIGSVRGKVAILVDDIYSTGTTLAAAAKACKAAGAERILACVTHGLLMAGDVLEKSDIERLFVTNTVPGNEVSKAPKVETISVAKLLGEALERLLTARSISSLFTADEPEF